MKSYVKDAHDYVKSKNKKMLVNLSKYGLDLGDYGYFDEKNNLTTKKTKDFEKNLYGKITGFGLSIFYPRDPLILTITTQKGGVYSVRARHFRLKK